MAKVPMRSGFTLIPEGTYVFRIYEVEQDETFGKIIVKLVNAQGMTQIERFSLKNKNNEWNEGALNAFSHFAKNALNDFTREDVEPMELVDHYIKAEVIHSDPIPNRNDPSKNIVFANLGDKFPAEGFDTEPVKMALTLGKNATATKNSLNLDKLLD